jgi:ubiquinone/menaquinone biosynthesis C-methylase UbiE
MNSAAAEPHFLQPGGHTAHGPMVDYRLGKLADLGVLSGEWLDLGCAEGHWSVALAQRGASGVIGVEPIESRVAEANARPHPPTVSFAVGQAEALPMPDQSFDGVLLNEVLEHVAHEQATLREVVRVLRPGGHLALFSPNRWFPFEGHGARWNEHRSLWGRPVPLMPWLPARLTRRFATARNYWPRQLRDQITRAGMEISCSGWALIQFAQYPWLPESMIHSYRRNLPRIEHSPLARFFAVSVFVLARRPD